MNENLLRTYCALLAYRHNMKLLHWRVRGEHFDCVHERLDDYSKKLDTFIDEIAEIMLMCQDETHPLSLEESINFLQSDNNEYLFVDAGSDYSGDDVKNYTQFMFDSLIRLYDVISNDNSLLSGIRSKTDEHQYWLLLENNYKNNRR